MLELLFTPKAIFDLGCIYEYTLSKWGIIQADKYHDELYVELEKISKFPHLGKEYQYTQLNYRYYHVNRHYVFIK